MEELWSLSAGAMAERIAAKKVSATEVVEAHIQRIRKVNPQVNAIVRVLEDEALACAREADRKTCSGEQLGPLHGVPFTIKENIDVAGLPTTWGVPAFADAIPSRDAPVVARMRGAGAIPIGRTNLPDMALRLDTGSSLYGATQNPWNAARTAGGSSGGEAVALATGMSAIGLGNDIGGSLRSPASACGIASIRPSAGRVPDAGTVPGEDRLLALQLLNVQGPMARTVDDVRLALRVLIGADPRDPWSIDAPFEGLKVRRPVRVAVVASPFGDHVNSAVSSAVRSAADLLTAAGYDVVEAVPPRYEEAEATWIRFLFGDYEAVLDHLAPVMGSKGLDFLFAVRDSVPRVTDTRAMSELFRERDGLARAWSMFMADHPLILTPTWTELPFETGFDTETAEGARATRNMVRPMMPANLFGLPSACVPAAHDRETNLPIGVLLTGQRFREDMCLEAAGVVEAGFPSMTPIDPVL